MTQTVEFNLLTPEGVAIKSVYDGEITFDDQSSGGDDQSTTTLESDYTLKLTNAKAEVA